MIKRILKYVIKKIARYRKIIWSVVFIIFVCFFLFYFFDIYLNATIAEWFSRKFLDKEIVDLSILNKEVMNNIFNWKLFKKYCISAVFVVICLLVIGTQILSNRHVIIVRRQERAWMEKLVEAISMGEKLENFPVEYNIIARKVELLMEKQVKGSSEKNKENERISDRITYLAHDLRTPLTSIIGYLNLFLDAPEMPSSVKSDYMKKTLNKAKHLEALVNDFFEITKYNSQKMILNRQRINLKYMFVQLADEFFPILESKKLRIDINVAKDLSIKVDSEKMARVFSNLLKNACNYSFEYTTIHIIAETREDTIEILFENKGKLIPECQQEQVFDHFVRLDEARSSDSGGSGIGLAIVKAIVNQHEGEITVYTRDCNNIFKIILPNTE